MAHKGREVMEMAQEKEKAEEVSLKGVFAEYLKVNRDLASRIFFDLEHDVEKLAVNANADTDEKNRYSFLIGRLVEAFGLLYASLQTVEEVADYHNEDVSDAIVVSIEVLLQAYADLKAGRPLSEVNDHLGDYVTRLDKTIVNLITDLANMAKDG